MKNKQSLFLFSLCPLIPATSRFAYALVFSAAILFYYGAGLLVRELVKRLNIGHFAQVLELAGLAGTAALFYESSPESIRFWRYHSRCISIFPLFHTCFSSVSTQKTGALTVFHR